MSADDRGTAVVRIADSVREGIKQGRFAPGQRLIESGLTAELGVSRGPLREALAWLASEGHLVLVPNRGAVVRRWTRQDVRDLFAVREVLEGQAAALAALGGSADQRRAVLDIVTSFEHADDAHAYMSHNSVFHDRIATLSANPQLERLIEQVATNAYRVRFRQVVEVADRRALLDDHRHVAQAIAEGDPPGAERAMRAHVRRSLELTMSLPDGAFE
jgi:DNA-binding GntR family transcriptional regulator